MQRSDYPGFAKHRSEHARLIKVLQEQISHIRAGRIGALEDLRVQMLDWIVSHTNGYDFDTFIRSGFFDPEKLS